MTLTRIQGTIEIIEFSDKPEKVKIILDKAEGIDMVYDMIQDEQNFILEKKDGNEKISKLIVTNPLTSKMENGELEIISIS